MIELDIYSVEIGQASCGAPLLLLREAEGSRYLPIWIGTQEAAAILDTVEGRVPARPMTHDLLVNILKDLGHVDIRGLITDVKEGTFIGELIIDEVAVSARPSDIVALAVRAGFKVSCPSWLIAEVGVELSGESEDEVEKFKEFLDNVTATDFEKENPS